MNKEKSKRKIFLRIFAISLLTLFLIFAGFMIFFNAKINKYSSSIDFNKQQITSAYSKPEIYDYEGNIANFSNTSSVIKFEDLNKNTINAFISIEDKNFYKHNGFNYKRMAKAALTNFKSKSFKEGASTISQQLVKNTLLTSEKTVNRKLKEIALTKKLEKQFSKNEILEIYLNTIYFGNNNFGIENASLNYFNKHANMLSLNESAALASIIKSPSYYSSPENLEALNTRKNLVLSSMLKDKMISNVEYESALGEKIKLNYQTNLKSSISYQNGVLLEAADKLGISTKQLYGGKYKIYTYFNPSLQNEANEILSNNVNSKYESNCVVIDNETNGITTLSSTLSNASSLKRQAGSVMKPVLVYAPAIEMNKVYLETPILDEKTSFDGYIPQNADGKFHGYVSVNYAIEKSLNIPAVKTLEYIGINNAKEISSRMGIDFANEENLSMALGSSKNGHSIIDIAGAYSTFSNNGRFEKPHFIKEIRDSENNVIYQHKNNQKQVIREDTAYLMTKSLKNVAKQGTAKKLSDLNFDIFSKTGTVGAGEFGQNSDAYNVTSTNKHTIAVWVGSKNNNLENLLPKEINGSNTPTSCVKRVAEYLYKDNKPGNFAKPSSIKEVEIDLIDLQENNKITLASSLTPDRYKKTIEISANNIPKEKSINFETPTAPTLSLQLGDNNKSVKLSFSAKEYEIYEILKNDKQLKLIENSTGTVTFEDNNVDFGKNYKYELICKNTNSKLADRIASTSKEIFIPNVKVKFDESQIKNLDSSHEFLFKKNKA